MEAPPSPLSSRPKRSAVERSAVRRPFLGNVFRQRGVMGLWPTQGAEKRHLFTNDRRWRHRPPLCPLDRSAAQWRDLRFSGPFLGMFFDREESWAFGPPKVMKNGDRLRRFSPKRCESPAN